MINPYFQIAVGGAIGAVARVVVFRALPVQGFPLATLVVNSSGSFMMGLLAALLAQQSAAGPLLMTGILGSFTTFSAFSLDALTLWEKGHALLMASYVISSVLVSLVAVFAGMAMGRGLLP